MNKILLKGIFRRIFLKELVFTAFPIVPVDLLLPGGRKRSAGSDLTDRIPHSPIVEGGSPGITAEINGVILLDAKAFCSLQSIDVGA